MLESLLIDNFNIFFIEANVEGLVDTQAGILSHLFLLIGQKVLSPVEFLLVLALLGVGEDGWRTQLHKIPDLINLLCKSLLGQLLFLQLCPSHLQLDDVEIDDLLNFAVVFNGLRKGIIIKVLEELHSLIMQLIKVLLKLLQIQCKFFT